MFSRKPAKFAVAGLVAIVAGLGAYAIGSSSSGSSASSATAAPAAQGPLGGPQNGQRPPRMGTPVTGAAADKAKAAALAKYPGTADLVIKLNDGSYGVRVTTSKGVYRVSVSKSFTVTGAQQGGPGGAGRGPGARGGGFGPPPGAPTQ